MNYNLEVLNDKEFENLSKDLLEKILKVQLQSFKTGKDGGIDLRYSTHNLNEIIVQAKAYTKSTYVNLKSTLKMEKEKMARLSPQPLRYILTTTCNLSPQQVNEIATIMHPYVTSAQDIYGRDRIESLISDHHDIEKKYYKLWLTSTNVLKAILHNGQRSQSDFHRTKILKNASLYVPTKNLQNAIDKLNENKFVIISGEPGVGKTTLAYILICDLLGKGYELINIDEKISDALHLLSEDPETKQVLFFDDFLGANINAILNPKNTENKIVSLIEQIESSKNKFLILTSRTTILNQAKDNYEHFARQKFDKRSKYELVLNNYTLLDKAKIVYNHLYFNNMGDEYKIHFFENKSYLKIIEHKNYFPRLIEFITDQKNYDHEYYTTVDEFIFKNLDNPREIWKVAFERQLEDEDRFLLLSLFSFAKTRVRHDELEHAFNCRYNYEIRENGIHKKLDPFNRSLKKLLGSFASSIKTKDGANEYQLLNPSIADFLINYLKKSKEERNRVIFSISSPNQLLGYFDRTRKDKIILDDYFIKEYYPTFVNCLNNVMNKHYGHVIFDIIYCLDQFFSPKTINDTNIFIKYFNDLLNLGYGAYVFSPRLITILKSVKSCYPENIIKIVTDNWNLLMFLIIKNAYESDHLSEVRELHELYEIDLFKTISVQEIKEELTLKINSLFDEYVKDYELVVSDNDVLKTYHDTDETYTRSYINDKYWESYDSFFSDCGLIDFYENFNHDLDIDSYSLLHKILDRYSYEEDDYSSEITHDIDYSRNEEIQMIEDLFEK